MSAAETLSWQEAVATLTAERERAETAVRIVKRLGGPGDLTAAEIAYGDGRAETEAAIARYERQVATDRLRDLTAAYRCRVAEVGGCALRMDPYPRLEETRGVATMQCPVDGTQLVMTERSGVEIDYCPQCRGVWLDRGELDKIIERAAAQARRPARGCAAGPGAATTTRTATIPGAMARGSARASSASSSTSERRGPASRPSDHDAFRSAGPRQGPPRAGGVAD